MIQRESCDRYSMWHMESQYRWRYWDWFGGGAVMSLI
jgi:hypothetical protein